MLAALLYLVSLDTLIVNFKYTKIKAENNNKNPPGLKIQILKLNVIATWDQ